MELNCPSGVGSGKFAGGTGARNRENPSLEERRAADVTPETA
jgi:hypothetical protein